MVDQEHPVDAIILTGGRSSRMGGRHKPALTVGGSTVLDRTLTALVAAEPTVRVIIAGTDEGLSDRFRQRVTVVRENPPFAGPLAGVAAAVATFDPVIAGTVVLLGGDLPFLSHTTLQDLMTTVAVEGATVVSCVDATGHLQYLCSGWQRQTLRHQLAKIADPEGIRLRALFDGLEPVLIDCDPDELRDVDTPQDLARAVTTCDGRPVPEKLLDAVEQFGQHYPGNPVLDLSAQTVAELLDFARHIKYSSTRVNPTVAAFLAGQLAGSTNLSVTEALEKVFDTLTVQGDSALQGDA